MSEPRLESVLREAAPSAPQQLRDRVRALPVPTAGRAWRWRPALAAACVIAVAVGVGAAAIGGLSRSGAPDHTSLKGEASRLDIPSPRSIPRAPVNNGASSSGHGEALSSSLPKKAYGPA